MLFNFGTICDGSVLTVKLHLSEKFGSAVHRSCYFLSKIQVHIGRFSDQWFHLRGTQSRRQHFFYNINKQRTLRSWFRLFTSNLHLEHSLRILSLHVCISLFQSFHKFLRFLCAFSSTRFHYSQIHNRPFKYKININKTKRLDKLEISVCLTHK